MVWRLETSRGNESAKVKWQVIPYIKGRGLDLGCGPWKILPCAIGIDADPAVRPDLIGHVTDLSMFADGSMDYVYSSHCLEHLEDPRQALREWWRVVKPGGHLMLYLPHKDLYPNIGQFGANPDHKHDFVPDDVTRIMQRVASAWDLVENEVRNERDEYSFLQVYRKLDASIERLASYKLRPDPKTVTMVFRPGAVGDMVIASSIFHLLPRPIWVWTNPRGAQVLQGDPRIDGLIVHQEGITPDNMGVLRELFAYLEGRYGRFVNLLESLEGGVLFEPWQSAFYWPAELRRERCDVSYVQFAHQVAGVLFDPKPSYRPSPEESRVAQARRDAEGRFIMFGLSGSGVQKRYPHSARLLEALLDAFPEHNIVCVGEWDHARHPLPRHARVVVDGAANPMRDTLALAQFADLVIGQETGLMWAVAMCEIPKVLLLSHSSPRNLGLDWKRTQVLHAHQGRVACWPCHRMHHDWTHCNMDDKTGMAACQADIPVEAIVQAARRALVIDALATAVT
jgi:predicted SAM-dependent methyltransferase/ADP-heptose:LPS heptosyltransferase